MREEQIKRSVGKGVMELGIMCLALCLFSGCIHRESPLVIVSRSHPARPGWSKKDVWEVGNVIHFTGESTMKKSKERAKDEAIDAAVRNFLSYGGIKEKRVHEMFRSEFSPKVIMAAKRRESGPYEVMMSDYYWEKHMVKKTKMCLYKGYAQLRFPITRWTEFRRYIRSAVEQKYDKKMYDH
jgi:hypothetical protein